MALFPRMVGPGLGPTLAEDVLTQLWAQANERAAEKRKRLAEERLTIWDEDFKPLVKRAIRRQYTDPETQRGMLAIASDTLNPAKDIIKAVACCYTHGVCRFLEDASEEEEKAWDELLEEDGISHQAILWNRLAYGLGPVVVVPVVRPDGRLVREVLLPHQTDVMTDPSDPLGPPIAVRWEICDGTNVDQDNAERVRYVVVDREAWRYFNRKNHPVPGPTGQAVVPHGVTDNNGDPACPAVVVRLDDPRDPDWWSATTNDRLFQGTIEVAVKYTRMKWVRGFQDSYRMVAILSSNEELAEGQTLTDPSDAVKLIRQGSGAPPKLDVADLNVNPDHHLAEIRALVSSLELAHGLPAGTVQYDMSGSRPAASVHVSAQTLSRLQSEQRPFLIRAERRLAMLTASVVRAGQHRLAGDIPPPDEMWERFGVEFPELNGIENPKERREQDKFELQHGLISPVDLGKRKWPWMTRRQVQAHMDRLLDEKAKHVEKQRSLQIPADGDAGGMAPNDATAQGLQGGRPPAQGDQPPPGGSGGDQS